jgi:hypothetical protein
MNMRKPKPKPMKPFKPGLRETSRQADVVTLELTLDPETAKHLHRIAKIAGHPPDVVATIIVAMQAYRVLGLADKKP